MHKTGIIKNGELAAPVAGAIVEMVDEHGDVLGFCQSGEDGRFNIELAEETTKIVIRKEGFTQKEYDHPKKLPKLIRLLEDDLLGYQPKLWFKPGEEVPIFVHSPSGWEASLCRHGQKKQVVLTLGQYPACEQLLPDAWFVEKGLYWTESFRYQIPEEAEPGLYSLLLENAEQTFAIPFVVSSPEPKHRLLVLASTNNWQSYNIWGGRNRYRSYENTQSKDFSIKIPLWNELTSRVGKSLPASWTNTIRKMLGLPPKEKPWMFQKLSIKRPFTNCALEDEHPEIPFTNHLGGGEWRVLAWLEREGIEYDMISGFELHQQPEILNEYEAVLFSTHCEYWSKAMYDGLKEAHRQHGLSILNISGNSIYREVDFFHDGSHRCLSLHFKDSVEDETKVIGVRFDESDYGTCAPYKVTAPYHWIFDGLEDIQKETVFGQETLNYYTPAKSGRYDPGRPGSAQGLTGKGASGWETDKLSKTAPDDITKVAKGQNRWGGADMIVREPKGTRGGLFSASSITFGGALLVDEVCSQITKNALREFTVEPA